jgi:glucose/arabinose dehydrogenase
MVMKNHQKFVIVRLIFLILILLSFSWKYFGSALARAKVAFEGPVINDSTLAAQLVVGGLKTPSAMAFLGPDDILITEKNTGNVMRAVNGVISDQPVLHVSITKKDERGLLGLAVSDTENEKKHVFLYYTETELNESGEQGPDPLGNEVYRYDLGEINL